MTTYKFEWHGSDPVMDFVNTLDERLSSAPEERLQNYAALVAFTHQAHLIEDTTARCLLQHLHTPAANHVWSRAVQFRDAVCAVLHAHGSHEEPPHAALVHVEAEIHRAEAVRQLMVNTAGFAWAWREPDAPERPLWELTVAVERLLVSARVARVKQCGADDCGVLFVDESRAGLRRWCSMATCGNRNKARRFRSAHTGSN